MKKYLDHEYSNTYTFLYQYTFYLLAQIARPGPVAQNLRLNADQENQTQLYFQPIKSAHLGLAFDF